MSLFGGGFLILYWNVEYPDMRHQSWCPDLEDLKRIIDLHTKPQPDGRIFDYQVYDLVQMTKEEVMEEFRNEGLVDDNEN